MFLWLECFGMPPHGWLSKSFKSIGELWGKVVALDKNAEYGSDLSAGWVLVETSFLSTIQDWVKLSLESREFDVFVRQVGRFVVEGAKKEDHKELSEDSANEAPNMATSSMKRVDIDSGSLQSTKEMITQASQELRIKGRMGRGRVYGG